MINQVSVAYLRLGSIAYKVYLIFKFLLDAGISLRLYISYNQLICMPSFLLRKSFVSIISYEPSVPYSLLSVVSVLVILSYYSMLYVPLALSICLFPILNSYILTPSINEYLYSSLLFFIFLEIMLFLAYFWYYFHNIEKCRCA